MSLDVKTTRNDVTSHVVHVTQPGEDLTADMLRSALRHAAVEAVPDDAVVRFSDRDEGFTQVVTFEWHTWPSWTVTR